jgi:hypothetical protein
MIGAGSWVGAMSAAELIWARVDIAVELTGITRARPGQRSLTYHSSHKHPNADTKDRNAMATGSFETFDSVSRRVGAAVHSCDYW